MSANVQVRLGTSSDSEAIAKVLLEAFGAYKEHYTAGAFEYVTPSAELIAKRFDEGPQWVAEIAGEIIGTVSLSTEPEGLYVRSMAVRSDAQGRGIGHKLMDAVNEFADGSDHERIFLYTTYFVTSAKAFYESHGYKWVRETTAEEWYGTPGLEMERILRKDEKRSVSKV